MNNDLISREALKKSMRKSMNERYISWTKTITVADIATLIFDEITYAPTVLHDNYSMGYQDGVKKVLSERPQGKWISVKDRLPDKDGDYIVTTEMFLPIDNFIREVEVTEYNIVTGFCCETHAIKVIAWQELILPEAYKEAENE